MPYACALSTVYKGCTPDAPAMPTGFAMVHPVSTPRTPNVHPLYTRLLCLGKSLGFGGYWDWTFGRFLAVSCRLKLWRGPRPILAFSLQPFPSNLRAVCGPIQAGWRNQTRSISRSFKARLADRREPFEGDYAIIAKPWDWRFTPPPYPDPSHT